MAYNKTQVIHILFTNKIVMLNSQKMTVFIGSKLEAQRFNVVFCPYRKSALFGHGGPNQTLLSARSSFISDQWPPHKITLTDESNERRTIRCANTYTQINKHTRKQTPKHTHINTFHIAVYRQ